jgi:WD40 repeat protein
MSGVSVETEPGVIRDDLRAHHDAFVSYSHNDREFALRLRSALEARGKSAWIDESDIAGASRWRDELKRAIEAADAFVFLVSPDAVASKGCKQELAYAAGLNKRIVPVRVRETPRMDLPESLSAYQSVPSREPFEKDFGGSVAQLVTAIETDHDWVHEHTDWGQKALEWDRQNREQSFLMSGAELDAAEEWLRRASGRRPEPTKLQIDYVFLSRRHAMRRLRRTRAIALTALAIVSALAVIAILVRNEAVNEKLIATSRQLAAQSLLQLSSDPQLSLLLGVQSARVRHTSEALDALRRALPANHLLRTLQADGQPIESAALSPNGSLVAAASHNNVVRVWDASSGGRVRMLLGHAGPVQGVVFDATGSKVLTWAQDGTARLWDVAGRQPPIVMKDPNDYRILHASISPNGRFVATTTFLHSPPRIWDALTGHFLFALGKGVGPVPDIEFSPDGSLIATGSYDGTAAVWSAKTGQRLETLKVSGRVASTPAALVVGEAIFSSDGRHLLTSSSDASGGHADARLWDVSSTRPLTPPMSGGYARQSPDGKLVVTTGNDGRARVWDGSSGRLEKTLGGADPIAGPAQFSADDSNGQPRYVVTGSQDGTAVVWDPLHGSIVASLVGTQSAVTPAGFSPDAMRVLTFGGDGAARMWSTRAVLPQPASVPAALDAAANGSATRVRSSFALDTDPLSPLRAFWVPSNSAVVVDVRTGAFVAQGPFPVDAQVRPTPSNGYVAFDRGGHVMLVMGNGHAQLHAARGGRLLHTLAGVGSLTVDGAVSPDGSLVAAADASDQIAVWNVATGARLATFNRHHPQSNVGSNITLKFSPDGKLLLTADQSGVSFVWEARTGRVLNEIHGPAPQPLMYNAVEGGAISPNDQLVVSTTGWNNDAHVYRVGHPGELISLHGHSDGIDDATFSPDSTLIATTAGHSDCSGPFVTAICDNSVRVWDTEQSAPLLTLTNDGGTRVDFSPDGNSIVTNKVFPYETLACIVCGGFGRMQTLALRAEVRQFTREERARYLSG